MESISGKISNNKIILNMKHLENGIKMNNTKEKLQIVDEHWQMFADISK